MKNGLIGWKLNRSDFSTFGVQGALFGGKFRKAKFPSYFCFGDDSPIWI